MATQKQIDANRRNAQLSTGPRIPEGKAAVRLNALRHGLRARTVVLPGEDREEFNRLCDLLEQEWLPRTSTELFYLEQMAVSQWKLTRMEIGEADVYQEVTGAKVQIPLLDRIWRAQCRMERSFARAQRELERIQTSRSFQAQQPQEDLIAGEAVDGESEAEPQPLPAELPSLAAPPPHVAHFENAANFPPRPASLRTPPSAPNSMPPELSHHASTNRTPA